MCTAWGVPWPSDDDLRADADTAWAVEVGLVDLGGSDAAAFDDEWAAFSDAATGTVHVSSCETDSVGADPEVWLRELEHQVRVRQRATAEEYRLIRLVLERAAADTVPWVGADPTLDLAWNDSRGRSIAAVRRDRRDMAERAAIAEIATRLRLSEQTVRTRAAHAETLQTRCPELWNAFADGSVSERHVVESARLATTLPPVAESSAPTESERACSDGDSTEPCVTGRDEIFDDAAAPADPPTAPSDAAQRVCDAPESWRAFDHGALDRALRLPPARFTVAARALRERVHRESVEARHRRAARDRGVWVTPELDGMATLTALLPADRAYDALGRVDRIARQLRVAPDEERTLAQLRADAVADLLTRPQMADAPGAPGVASPDPVSRATPAARPSRPASIVVTVPALTLLGAGSEPATLDGYGPIDLDTARRLAGEATSWVRVLTHPLSGAPLALDRTVYRVPTALRRWLGVTSPTCVFPGCGRPARDCDLDHLTAWIDGGRTEDDNLAPECRHHHRLRHETRWRPSRAPDTGEVRWTSPLGTEIPEDPPPF